MVTIGILTHALHKIDKGDVYSYEPYVREMNLWAKYVDEIVIVAPISILDVEAIEIAYQHQKITIVSIPNFDVKTIKNILKTIFVLPIILFKIGKVMLKVNYIHLRCPGNVGLLASLIQILFPFKKKTAKYAGNWDPKAKNQPFTYRLQKYILSNTFVTKNMKVMVYGEWPNQTNNVIPFFTASYSALEKKQFQPKKLKGTIHLIFVGGLTVGKQPLKSVKVVDSLLKKGIDAQLSIYGDGVEKQNIEKYIQQHQLENHITLYGNQNKEVIKSAFQKSHFLIFISKSEGWPKVVAEAMFWGCLPITTKVSCVPYMLNNNERGSLVNDDVDEIVNEILQYVRQQELYDLKCKNASDWSQQYTLETFENAIKDLIYA